ncbi:MAG: NADH-quinone oxidoreductase subunit N [Anaerolineales bacterium]|nr:NADH-quinone oxidoreductase subunit N [Anaerolineales bacterium]
MTLSILVDNLVSILPLVVVVLWASVLLVVEAFWLHNRKGWTALLACIGLALALGFAVAQFGRPTQQPFGGMVAVDGFSTFLNILFLGSGLAGIALAYDYLKRMGIERGEYYPLLMFSISGMMLMSLAADLIVIFLALELLSIPLYVLAAFARPRLESEEAGLKYFLLGAFAGSFFVYGVALVFGATGTTALAKVAAAVAGGTANMALLVVGGALMLIGLGFKVAAVPFHMWTPDVYQGAPSAVTAFMAVGAKAGGFAALLRIFVATLPVLAADLTPILWGISALTMFLGNVVAIAQSNIKRMLAYSSIAHAGYILMALVPFGQGDVAPGAVASALFYLAAYAFTSFGAWAVVIALEKAEGQGLALDDYAGLGRKYPALAAAMVVFMLSFTGVPPTLGFMGKFYLFRSVMEGGYTGLALIGVLTSLISAYYYLRVVVIMYMREGEPEVRPDTWLRLTAFVSAIATVALALFSTPLLNWAAEAVLFLF